MSGWAPHNRSKVTSTAEMLNTFFAFRNRMMIEASTSHKQRVEEALDLEGLYAFAKKTLGASVSSSESDTESFSDDESSHEDIKDERK